EASQGPGENILLRKVSQSLQVAEEIEVELEIGVERPSQFPQTAQSLYLDLDHLQFPLLLRPWKAGDRFRPLGMQGRHQKLKDFLINKKRSRFEKEQVWVIESGGKICCIPGWQVDEGFKIRPETKNCLLIHWRTGRQF
ncbi:MAG: tRNA lysidine(34) synthetase TilS, partial [Bacteroidota bacterium]